MPRELVWRAVASAIFVAVFTWSLASDRWVIAATTGLLTLANLTFLGVGFIAWRRGLLREHS